MTLLVERLVPICKPEFLHRAQLNLEAIKAECRPITDIRNRKVAHNDLSTSLNYKENPLPGVGRIRIANALSKIVDLMNMIQLHYEDGETAYSKCIQRGTGKDLLSLLRIAVDHEMQRRELEKAKFKSDP